MVQDSAKVQLDPDTAVVLAQPSGDGTCKYCGEPAVYFCIRDFEDIQYHFCHAEACRIKALPETNGVVPTGETISTDELTRAIARWAESVTRKGEGGG